VIYAGTLQALTLPQNMKCPFETFFLSPTNVEEIEISNSDKGARFIFVCSEGLICARIILNPIRLMKINLELNCFLRHIYEGG